MAITTQPVPALPLTDCSSVARALALSALAPRCCWCEQLIIRFDETRAMGAGEFAHTDCADECERWMAKQDEPEDDAFDDVDIAVQKAAEDREIAERDRAEQEEMECEDGAAW